jgi:toxin HigB-1
MTFALSCFRRPITVGRCSPLGYTYHIKIRNIIHKGVKRLYAEDSPKGVSAVTVNKLRMMLAFLQDMESEDELRTIPVWKAHRLTGDRKGVWSLHVTPNWRLTFCIDEDEICDLNLEDYH